VAAEAASAGGKLGPLATGEALIRRIYGESEEAHRRLLKSLAETPDQWVLASVLATCCHSDETSGR
jgi:hypothetical protein